MVLDTVDSGFVVKQNIRQQILWKRKLFQRKGSKVKGADQGQVYPSEACLQCHLQVAAAS